MTAASIPSRSAARRSPALRPLDDHGFDLPLNLPPFDPADLRVIRLSLGFALGMVLAAALAGDAYLYALMQPVRITADTIAARQLAADLLPWSFAFTMLAVAGCLAAARWGRLLVPGGAGRDDPRAVPGFMRS